MHEQRFGGEGHRRRNSKIEDRKSPYEGEFRLSMRSLRSAQVFELQKHDSGFSIIELLVTLAILMIVSAAVFGMLNVAQQRYHTEQQVLDSFQNARVGVEQLTREIHAAGFPAATHYINQPSTGTGCSGGSVVNPPWSALNCGNMQRQYATDFRGYDSTLAFSETCTPSSSCAVPDAYDLSMEEDLDPSNTNCPNQVEILEYKLMDAGNGTDTLMRSVTSKPGSAASMTYCLPTWTGWKNNTWVPFVENVVNRNTAVIQANGIGPQPPNAPMANIPLFTYGFPATMSTVAPWNITTVYINLWVRTQGADIQTGQVKVMNIQSVAQRLNPER